MSTENAIHHLDAAIKALCLEAYGADDPADLSAVEHFTIAEDLKRIDSAIGPKGKSIFAKVADSIEEAYVEILAAREAFTSASPPQAHPSTEISFRLDHRDKLFAGHPAGFSKAGLAHEGNEPQLAAKLNSEMGGFDHDASPFQQENSTVGPNDLVAEMRVPAPQPQTMQISATDDPDRPWEPWSMIPVGDQRNIIREVLSEYGQTALAYFTGKLMALAPISENPEPLPFKVWRQRRTPSPETKTVGGYTLPPTAHGRPAPVLPAKSNIGEGAPVFIPAFSGAPPQNNSKVATKPAHAHCCKLHFLPEGIFFAAFRRPSSACFFRSSRTVSAVSGFVRASSLVGSCFSVIFKASVGVKERTCQKLNGSPVTPPPAPLTSQDPESTYKLNAHVPMAAVASRPSSKTICRFCFMSVHLEETLTKTIRLKSPAPQINAVDAQPNGSSSETSRPSSLIAVINVLRPNSCIITPRTRSTIASLAETNAGVGSALKGAIASIASRAVVIEAKVPSCCLNTTGFRQRVRSSIRRSQNVLNLIREFQPLGKPALASRKSTLSPPPQTRDAL